MKLKYGKKNLNSLMILIIIILTILKSHSLSNFKAIYLSDNYYFIITATNIYYYSTATNQNIYTVTFNDNQKINNQKESEMVTFGVFRGQNDIANLLIVKHYVYAMMNGNSVCTGELNPIIGYPSEVYPFTCIQYNSNKNCYYVVGFENSSKVLTLILFENTVPSCTSNSVYTVTINIESDNFSCQLMQSPSNGEVLTCFYQSSN